MDAQSESKLAEVNPSLAQAVRMMDADVSARGGSLRVVSGYRSYTQQAELYANRANNRNPVAAPGTSKHEQGLAVDLTWSGVSQSYVGALGESLGLRWGGRFSKPDPGHFELAGALDLAGLNLADVPQEYVIGGIAFLVLLLLVR